MNFWKLLGQISILSSIVMIVKMIISTFNYFQVDNVVVVSVILTLGFCYFLINVFGVIFASYINLFIVKYFKKREINKSNLLKTIILLVSVIIYIIYSVNYMFTHDFSIFNPGVFGSYLLIISFYAKKTKFSL